MGKIKIKLTTDTLPVILQVMNRYIVSYEIKTMDCKATLISLTEVMLLLTRAIVDCNFYPKEKITIRIQESNAMFIFSHFAGGEHEGYENVAMNQMLNQIERQLFIAGKYDFKVIDNFVKP